MRMQWIGLITGIVCLAAAARAEDLVAANGMPVSGEIQDRQPEGVTIRMASGTMLFPWGALSPATRFRHQPLFRNRMKDVLAGRPLPYPGTHSPDLEPRPVDNAAPSPAAPAPPSIDPDAPPLPEAATPPKPVEGRVSDKFNVSDFPKIDLRQPNDAYYMGFRFGEGEDQLVLLCLDRKDPQAAYDRLFVYMPGHPEYKEPKVLRGMVSGSRSVEYRPFKVVSQDAEGRRMELEIGLSSKDEWSFLVTVTRGPVSYRLYKKASPARSTQFRIFVLGGKPELRVSAHEGGKSIGVKLLLGEWNMLPLKGLPNMIDLEILDDKGMQAFTKKLRAGNDDFMDETKAWMTPVSRVKKDTPYTMRATINLGPLLGGVIKDEQPFTLVDPK